MKIEIHKDKNCAWAEVNGQFIYGKNVDEVKKALDLKAVHDGFAVDFQEK